LVTKDFELATTAGSTVINPMTNMVVEQLAGDETLTQEDAEAKVVTSVTDSGLEASKDLIFGDYITDSTEEAKALNAIGETLVDHSDLPVEKQLELTNAVADEAQTIIEDSPLEIDDFSPIVNIPTVGNPITVDPNSRPVDTENGVLENITLEPSDVWVELDASTYFQDAEDDALTFELKELANDLNGLTISSTDGTMTGDLTTAGTFNYQIFAKDEHGALSYPLNLKVIKLAENLAPEVVEEEQTRLQSIINGWQLQEGEIFNQTIDLSGLFNDTDGDIVKYRSGALTVDGLTITPTEDTSSIVTISGTPSKSYSAGQTFNVGGVDNDRAPTYVTFTLPEILEGTPVEPPQPELGFTQAHFDNQEWKMGSFADNDGEIGYASLAKDTHGLMFCWGSNSDERYSGNMSDALDQWGNSYAPFTKLAELDKHDDYMSHQDKDCMDVTINDGKIIDKEGSIYEMLYQHKPAEGEYQIILKVNQDELFWLDSTSSTFAQTSPASEKIISGFTDFDLTVEAGEEFDPELDGYPLTYAAGQFVYAENSYDYKSIKPTGFETPGNLSYVLDSFGREGIVLEETGSDSDYKTRYRYIQREFGDFYIGVKWSEEPQWNYVSAPEFGLYSYDQESMEKVIDKLPLIQD
ncbi:acid phosphatase, partial [Vibrio sp. SG41-7]|uniref:acid phosphatase n=1 Tax=Vibrio sp. SG41-7 TaxID=2760973 RepID=UPI001600FB93